MDTNILTKISKKVSANLSDEQIVVQIEEFSNIDTIYSYLVYAKYKNDVLKGWLIEYNISQTDKFNTLQVKDIVNDIIKAVLDNKYSNKHKPVIAYKQPSLELMLELYMPLMQRYVRLQCDRWSDLEYNDAMSICMLTMTLLYKKGYYIHKNLLRKSFENHILMELRHNRNKPEIFSLDQIVHDDGENGAISLIDTLVDKNEEFRKQDEEDEEIYHEIFEEVRSIIVELIGERQFEQLLRDYGKKHTTPWSRKKMQQIKNKMKSLGITLKSLRRNL